MQEAAVDRGVDKQLLERFQREIKTRVPYLREGEAGPIVNATPLVDMTDSLLECARVEYGLEISGRNIQVLGKFDSQIFGGSVKVRPAVQIIEDAIKSGRLRSGQTIFEATSGNFGIALGLLGKLGLNVVALVSRKLQSGVLQELEKSGVKPVDLDIDICPAPGLKMDPNLLVAKTVSANVREQLSQLGMDVSIFDKSSLAIEDLLGRQDVISLAQLLARIYNGFCPSQYDNELNVKCHEALTAPEIDQQLNALGLLLGDFRILSAFGTGGTSTGISRYVQKKYGKKSVHVVFPLSNQDVAGIRTKEKALGLRFYEPESYLGQHEVDFEAARRVLRFFAGKGSDIGESSALVLYACLQMLNYGVADRFVVIVADGLEKYAKSVELLAESAPRLEVTLEEASSGLADYGEVLWTHAMFAPKEEGIRLIASSLGCSEDKVKVARAQDVQTLISTQEVPETLNRLIPRDKPKLLLVCMVGGTSLSVAQLLAKKGIRAESLTGGIIGLSETSGQQPPDLVQIASE